jgi:hypothetical protein
MQASKAIEPQGQMQRSGTILQIHSASHFSDYSVSSVYLSLKMKTDPELYINYLKLYGESLYITVQLMHLFVIKH